MSMSKCPSCKQSLAHITAKGDMTCGFITSICRHCKQSWIELWWHEEERLCGCYFKLGRGKASLPK